MTAAHYIGDQSFSLRPCERLTPAEDEVRLDVSYTGICGTDMHIYHGVMDQRVAPPQIIGHEMSGVVAEVGSGVQGFRQGDRVVVRPLDYCGDCPACQAGHSHICHHLRFMGIDTPGAFQNSWTVKARTLHQLPDSLSLQQGALIEPLAVACHDVARSRLTSGETAVVLGGGPIGQLVAQVANGVGANTLLSEVNDSRREFAEQAGVHTVNPLTDDINRFVEDWTDGRGADVVFEVTGVPAAVTTMTEIAGTRGRICMVAIHSEAPPVRLFDFFWKELEMLGARVYEATDFEHAILMLANRDLVLDSFITSISPLSAIGDAFAGLDKNPAGMKTLIDCSAQ